MLLFSVNARPLILHFGLRGVNFLIYIVKVDLGIASKFRFHY